MSTVFRVLAASLATLVIGAAATLLAAVGQGQYLEDYCFTNAPIPEDGNVVRGPRWEFPATFRCEWHGVGDITVQDWWPLVWVVGCLVAGLVAIVLVWRSLVARRPRDG